MNADGTGKHFLSVQVEGFQKMPDWAPDGRKILFVLGIESGGGSVYLINADGSGASRLGDDPTISGASPRWSPDGSKIVFSGYGGIGVMNADGTAHAPLTENLTLNNYSDLVPSWWQPQ